VALFLLGSFLFLLLLQEDLERWDVGSSEAEGCLLSWLEIVDAGVAHEVGFH